MLDLKGQKVKIVCPPAPRRDDDSAGGFKVGVPSRPSVKIEAKPAALLVESRTQQKSFLFLLEEKIWRAHIRKSEENFLLGGECQRAAAGWLPWSGFGQEFRIK